MSVTSSSAGLAKWHRRGKATKSTLSCYIGAHLACSSLPLCRFLEAILKILEANDAKNLTQFKQIAQYEDLVIPAEAGGAAPCACISCWALM